MDIQRSEANLYSKREEAGRIREIEGEREKRQTRMGEPGRRKSERNTQCLRASAQVSSWNELDVTTESTEDRDWYAREHTRPQATAEPFGISEPYGTERMCQASVPTPRSASDVDLSPYSRKASSVSFFKGLLLLSLSF